MERLTDLADQVHDAAIALEQLLLALDRHDRKPAGANRLEIDKEHAAELIAMRGQESLHAGAIAVRSTRRNKPNIMAEQLIVAHGGNRREHILARCAIGRRSAALPAIVIVFEVVP